MLLIAALLAVPTLDQLACSFCGPTPESTVSAKPVSHVEDDCRLNDGFETPGKSPGQEQPTHIHFCSFHSISIVLDGASIPAVQAVSEAVDNRKRRYTFRSAASIYHPPTRT